MGVGVVAGGHMGNVFEAAIPVVVGVEAQGPVVVGAEPEVPVVVKSRRCWTCGCGNRCRLQCRG